MADQKVTALTAETTPISTDILYMVDDPGGTAASKKVTFANASKALSPEGTAILSTGEAGATKYLREDGDGTCSWQAVAGGGNTLDQAYDQGGAGAGRSITADSGAVTITTAANIALDINQQGNFAGIDVSASGSFASANLVNISASSSGVTGALLRAFQSASGLSSGRVADFLYSKSGITANKTGDLIRHYCSRTLTAAATRSDDFDMTALTRQNVTNNAGATGNYAGSVLRVENQSTDTSSVAHNDTVKGIEVVMDADGTGAGIDITHNSISAVALNIVTAGTNSEGMGITITGDSLDNGSLLKVYSNSTANGGPLAKFHNDNTGGHTVLQLVNDDTASIALDIDSLTTTTNVVNVDGNSLTTGSIMYLKSTQAALTTGHGLLIDLDGNPSAISATSDGLGLQVNTERDCTSGAGFTDDFDSVYIYRETDVSNTATVGSSGSILKLISLAEETNGTMNADFVGLEIDHNPYHANDVYAISITCNNADSGAAGAIDVSSFSVAEPILNVPVDTTAVGAHYGRIAVNVTGVGIKYLDLFEAS